MPVSLILAVLGLGLGALDLAGIVHLPHFMGIAALALGALTLLLAIRVIATVRSIVVGASVLLLAAMSVFGPHALRHVF